MNASLWSVLIDISTLLPSVAGPERALAPKEKLSWTIIFGIVFLILKNLPLAGFANAKGHSIFYFLGASVGSAPLTVFELGCMPLLTAHVLLYLLIGTRKISIDMSNKDQRASFYAVRKLLSFLIASTMSVFLLGCGHYGSSFSMFSFRTWIVLAQLLFSQLIFALCEDCLMKGFGIPTGINLLITISVTETVFLAAFSPKSIACSIPGLSEYEGAVIAPFHSILSRADTLSAIVDSFSRYCGPNLVNVTAAAVTVGAVILFQSYFFEISVTSSRVRGWNGVYPVRLLDNYSLPVYLLIVVLANSYFISYCLWMFLGGNLLTFVTGAWEHISNGNLKPISGIPYLISPAIYRVDLIWSILPTAVYAIGVIYFTVLISRNLGEVLGNSPKEVARQFKDQQLAIRGFRDSSLIQVLDRYIPPAASAGGLIIGAIVAAADLLGASGSGCGIVVATMVIHSQVEGLMRDQERLLNT